MPTATRRTALRVLGPAGMVCYGIVHLLVGYLALRVAFGDRGEEADQRGALAEVGGGAGDLVLWLLAAGLLAYAAWQLLLAATGYRWVHRPARRTRKRFAAVARAVVGLSLGVTAVRLAGGGGGSGASGDQQQRTWTTDLLSLPAGRLLVGAVALTVVGIAVVLVRNGVRRAFLEDLNTVDLPAGGRRWVTRLGVAGYLAKGLVLGIVGMLIGIAALRRDADEAGGLDAALKALASQPFGTAALTVVALSLAAYGAYCLAAAKAHRT